MKGGRFAIKRRYCLVLKAQAFNPETDQCGDDGLKDTPVPMPNTEVKLQRAESSWGIAPCEDRASPRDDQAFGT